MGKWYRVFGSLEAAPDLAGCGPLVFEGDETGWFSAEVNAGEDTIFLERWLADEEGIRGELNSWAAFLETCTHSPHHGSLMERTIQARQLITLHHQGHEKLLDRLCRYLATTTAGFYHAEGVGFFEADGTLLVTEIDEGSLP